MATALTRLVMAVATVAATACSIDVRGDEAVVREERRFAVGADLELTVSTFDGALEVLSWDRPEVLVEIERRAASGGDAQALEVTAEQQGNRLIIDAPRPARSGGDSVIQLGGSRSPSVNFRVTVPSRLTLDARTGDGAVAARDLAGRITLRTADGAVNTDRLAGAVLVDSGDGAVIVRDVRGALDLHTGDGAVNVSGRLEALRIVTGDGPVRIDAAEGSTMTSEWTVESGDGAITVRLPPAFEAEIDAQSADGRITVEGLATATPSNDDDRPAQLRTTLGKGGQLLRLRTGDGPITIDR